MRSSSLVVLALALLVPGTAEAEREAAAVCPAPLSTCGGTSGEGAAECPPGYACTCVPSCPFCRDCPVRVCVASGGSSCSTACDCEPGLGCFDGQCLAGFAAVFCCEREPCPAAEQCQHMDGRMDRCSPPCVDQAWRCDSPGADDPACGAGRRCSCSASCPDCEDCGPGVCVPDRAPNPYRCRQDGSCAHAGDRCVCVSSCPACDDCPLGVCVPSCLADCDKRRAQVMRRVTRLIGRASRCTRDDECLRVETGTRCGGTCGAWVHRRFAGRVRSFVDHLDRRHCGTYREAGCPFATPRCAAEVGRCVQGRCVPRAPTRDGVSHQ